jgi:hypothetical protein
MPSDPHPGTDPESIDDIIERVTVDAYGDEGHVSFGCAFEDEVEHPIPATLAGTPVTLHHVDYDGNPARGLVGTITNDTGRHQVALTELHLEPGHPQQLLTADRRWLGLEG